MRKSVFLFLVSLLVTLLVANDYQVPSSEAIQQELTRVVVEQRHREAPLVNFEIDPQEIAASHHDYMIGGYNNLPLVTQQEFSQPYGYPADGQYAAFMYQQNASSLRRVYYFYRDASGNFTTATAISPNSVKEGFAGIAIDPLTGNPFVAWHSIVEPDNSYDCSMSYDMYNVVGGPGLWKQPFIVIDNPEVSIPFTGHDDDEFIWPQVWIGPSPQPDMGRVHIYGNNFTNNSAGTAMYNSIYGYADYEYDDVNFDMTLTDWTYQTFPVFDDWQYNNVKRAIKDMAVSDDGKVAFIGHAEDEFFCYLSVDYGETFEYYTQESIWDVFNPQNQDGTYVFEDTDGSPAELYIQPNGDGSHFNVLFTDDNSKLIYMTAFGLNTVESASNNQYYPAHFHPKMCSYDLNTGVFDFADLQIVGVDPYDDQPMIPYDLNEDGVVDSWDENGNVEFVSCWPTYFFEGDLQNGSFHESNFKISKNDELGWVVAIFMDGRNLMEAYYETPGFEDWDQVAEIAICISTDHGLTWSEPAYMNAKPDDENYYAQLDGMLPAYVYPADKIEYISENHGRVPIIFYDDNSYGSFNSSVGAGQNIGGTIMYAVLDIEFPTDTDDSQIGIPSIALSQNYPNPFNPSTTIAYNVKEATNVQLEVFNIKGQKVKTLVNEYRTPGEYYVTWDGKNDASEAMNSGVYFYRIKSENYSSAKKMILMK